MPLIMRFSCCCIFWGILLSISCKQRETYRSSGTFNSPVAPDSTVTVSPHSVTSSPVNSFIIQTGTTSPEQLIRFAKTLIGTPYVYGSADPATGFDCSGFITYVFNHFHIAVPRSSIDFTNVGQTIPLADAQPGDLILFTGTDSAEVEIGHMGIVITRKGEPLQFIHATSGKAMAVTISPLSPQYERRFVRIGRIFGL